MSATLESWREDLKLIGDLSTLNEQISAYVLRLLDADACRDEPPTPSCEHALGIRMASLGDELRLRAARKSADEQQRIATEHPAQNKKHRVPCEGRSTWSNSASAIYTP